jgi:hypothetical protein
MTLNCFEDFKMHLISHSSLRDGTTNTLLMRGNEIHYMLVACADSDFFTGGSSRVETKLTIFQNWRKLLIVERITDQIDLDQGGMEHYLDELLEEILVQGIKVVK